MNLPPLASIRESLAIGLLKKVFLVYIVFALTITSIHMFAEFRRAQEEVLVELNTVFTTIREPLAIAMWEADEEQVESLLEGIVNSNVIFGVSASEARGEIVEKVGRVVSAGKIQKIDDAFGVRLESSDNQNNLFGYQFPIHYSEIGSPKLIGHISLFSSDLVIFNKIKYQFFYIIITECMKAVILWLVFHWYGKRQLTRPLSGLAAKAFEITTDNLRPIEIKSSNNAPNEVDVLQDAFNIMISNLVVGVEKQKELYSELDSLKNNLQAEVNVRTKELREANRDLTAQIKERKEAEDKASQYGRILENSLNEIYVFDPKSLKFRYLNREARKNLGYSSKDFEALTVLDILPNFSESSFRDKTHPLHNNEEEMMIFESIHKRKDSSTYDVEVHLQLMTFPGIEVFVAIILDISDKRLLEEQLRQSQKMEVIGTLAGGVAHDLNNILSGIVSYPELLLTGIPEDSHLRKPLLTIQKSGQRAALIVEDLLTMARRSVPVTEVINLNQVILDQLDSPEMEKLVSFHPGIQVITELDDVLLNVKGSPMHLSKSIMNLVSNAAEAIPQKGVIRITTANIYFDKSVSGYEQIVDGDYVRVSVSDNGIGISTKDLEKIFEPFYTKKSMARSGTGLGMAVVWGTVKDHNGYIDIESAGGEGTTISIYLPVTRDKLKETTDAVSFEEYKGNGESILIVDDVVEQQNVASAMLIELGYSVSSVSSGEEAVAFLKNNSPDLLVLDMIMEPGMDGLDTFKQVLKINPHQKAIIASGYSRTDRVRELQQLGAGRYLKKPYTLMSIGFAVQEELRAEYTTVE